MATVESDVTGKVAESILQLDSARDFHLVTASRQNGLLGHFAFDLLRIQVALQCEQVTASEFSLHPHVAKRAGLEAALQTRMSISADLPFARQRAFESFRRPAAIEFCLVLAIVQNFLHSNVAVGVSRRLPALHFQLNLKDVNRDRYLTCQH